MTRIIRDHPRLVAFVAVYYSGLLAVGVVSGGPQVPFYALFVGAAAGSSRSFIEGSDWFAGLGLGALNETLEFLITR